MPQTVHRQLHRQPRSGPPGSEAVIDPPRRDPPPRSVNHNAGPAAASPCSGRTSLTYWSNDSTAHGITDATARQRGGLPRIALPNRTRQTPKDPSSGAAGFGREIGRVQHRRLPAPQPPPVDHLERAWHPETPATIPCEASGPPRPPPRPRCRRAPAAPGGSADGAPGDPRSRPRGRRCWPHGRSAPVPPRPAARTPPPSHSAGRTRSRGTTPSALVVADRRVRPLARATHESSCSERHSHGQTPVNSWKRRTVAPGTG